MRNFILILIFSLIQSCGPNCEKVYFKETDKTWLSNYKPGDTLIFKSQFNDFDTIFITNKIMKEPIGECRLFVNDYVAEYGRVDYEMKKDSFDLVQNYFIQIAADNKKRDATPVIRFLNMEYSNLMYKPLKSIPSKSNPKWKNVYIFNEKNCPYTNLEGKFGITEFEWDKNYGLVTYRNKNGEKWQFIKKE